MLGILRYYVIIIITTSNNSDFAFTSRKLGFYFLPWIFFQIVRTDCFSINIYFEDIIKSGKSSAWIKIVREKDNKYIRFQLLKK